MKARDVHFTLCALYNSASQLRLTDEDRYVIFSDLHMGTRGKRDEFKKNSSILLKALEEYYLPRQFTLVLNGDVEELQKFKLAKIQLKWAKAYDVFCAFRDSNRLVRILGNHDLDVIYDKNYIFSNELIESIIFKYKNNSLFLFHGHQALYVHEKYHRQISLLLRYVARPLNIKNVSPAYNSKKKYRVEKKVYQFSKANGIASVIGHTHRPLFKSLSKIDSLKFAIEMLIREYPTVDSERARQIRSEIRQMTRELRHAYERDKKLAMRSAPYDPLTVVPCMFNSGCCIGKRGITGIEIENGRIRLVYWYGKRRYKKYLRFFEDQPMPLDNSPFHRIVLKSDDLDSIFNRIYLLAEAGVGRKC